MNKKSILVILVNILLVFISCNASALTRSCKSRVELTYSLSPLGKWTIGGTHKAKNAILTNWGYSRKGSSPGWFASPNAARKRACKASALARPRTSDRIHKQLQGLCAEIDQPYFYVHGYRIRGSSHGINHWLHIELRGGSYDKSKNRIVWSCAEKKFVTG